jgi:methyl-accepting chemotaxis protein
MDKIKNLHNEESKGKKIKISIAVRLTAVAVGMLILLGVIIISFSAIKMENSIKEREKESLRNTAYTLKNAYYTLYKGDFSKIKDNMDSESVNSNEKALKSKGSANETENDAVSSATADIDAVSSATVDVLDTMTIMDTLHEETGIDISLFWGDIRVATSLVDDSGKRIVGTKLEDEVKNKVIDQGDEYFNDNLVIDGHPHFAYYIPITQEDKALGVLAVVKDSELIEKIVKKSTTDFILFELVITILAITVLFLILRRISKYIHQASVVLHDIAEGDLTIEVNKKLLNRNDEIGQLGISAILLRDKIREMMSNISDSIVTLSAAADELEQSTKKSRLTVNSVAKAMTDVAKGAMSQAEDTQHASCSIIEVGNEISSITDAVNVLKARAQDISKASEQADIIADKLEESANNTMSAIDKIANQTEATNMAAEDIKKALDVISDITESTNLLSLNASIEAARAGENGRGFGVVAGEIKALAEQSSKSAKEIADILSKLLSESEKSLEVVGNVKIAIKDQKSKLDDTRKQFEVVRDGVEESSNSIRSIYEKIMILDNHRDTLVDTIESLSAISEENAASTEETTASTDQLNETVEEISNNASELRHMAEVLKQSIEIFKLNN